MKNLLLLNLMLLASVVCFPQAGMPDLTFSDNGVTFTDIDDGITDYSYGIVFQPDGKIVAAGLSGDFQWNFYEEQSLARYNSDGSLDSSFGINGIVTNLNADVGLALLLQPDGKILVLGSDYKPSTLSDFALVRYNADGSLDLSFNNSGMVTTDFNLNDDYVEAATLQPDGKIIVAGTAESGINEEFIGIARYLENGTLDSSFGTSGKATFSVGPGSDRATGVAVQEDGKIVIAGKCYDGSNTQFCGVRLLEDGSLDTSFNGDGKIITPFNPGPGYSSYAKALALQPDGKIIIGGYAETNTNFDFAVLRYNPNGFLDSSFNGIGKVTTSLSTLNDEILALTLQPDGKIVCVGIKHSNSDMDCAVVRYQQDGSLDNSFGIGGVMIPELTDDDFATAVTLQADGKILITGTRYDNQDEWDFLVMRLLNDLDLPTGQDMNESSLNSIEVFPNPFSSSVNIRFSLPEQSKASICLYDLQGRKIKTLAERNFEEGVYNLYFPVQDLPNAIYFIQFKTAFGIQLTKLIKQ